MNTYWLTCREGPSKKREEIAWYADIEPVFMKQMRHENDIKPRKKSARLQLYRIDCRGYLAATRLESFVFDGNQ